MEDVSVAIIIIAIIIGSVVAPYFINTSVSGLYWDHDNNASTAPVPRTGATAVHLLTYAAIFTIGLATAAVMIIREVRKGGRKR